MKIALIGYGRMGKLIETLALNKEHEIVVIIDSSQVNLTADELAEKVGVADVAIDFSIAEAVKKNVKACCLADVSVVEGTTGWNYQFEEVKQFVDKNNGSFIFGANFSPGMGLFYRIVNYASELFSKFSDYEFFIEEQHHSRKVDATSGTALKLKSIVATHIDKDISMAATRAGNIPGTHRVGVDGNSEQILLEHLARSRESFALGAILAADWIIDKKGFWEFTDVLDEIIANK